MSNAYVDIRVADLQDAWMVRDYLQHCGRDAYIHSVNAGWAHVRSAVNYDDVTALKSWAVKEEVKIFSIETSIWRYEND